MAARARAVGSASSRSRVVGFCFVEGGVGGGGGAAARKASASLSISGASARALSTSLRSVGERRSSSVIERGRASDLFGFERRRKACEREMRRVECGRTTVYEGGESEKMVCRAWEGGGNWISC